MIKPIYQVAKSLLTKFYIYLSWMHSIYNGWFAFAALLVQGFAPRSSEFAIRSARFLSFSVQAFGFPLWRNLQVKYSYHCLLHFFRFLNRLQSDATRWPEITNSLYHWICIHYGLSKWYCNQEQMQYSLEGRNTRCVCRLYYLIWLLFIVDSSNLSTTKWPKKLPISP